MLKKSSFAKTVSGRRWEQPPQSAKVLVLKKNVGSLVAAAVVFPVQEPE